MGRSQFSLVMTSAVISVLMFPKEINSDKMHYKSSSSVVKTLITTNKETKINSLGNL